MPSEFYMVEAKLLLDCASEDIPRAEEIRTIVKDIWDIRMSKIRSSVDTLVKSTGSYAAVDHLTLMEINSIRPILPCALDQLYRMKKVNFTHGKFCFKLMCDSFKDSRVIRSQDTSYSLNMSSRTATPHRSV